MEVTQSALTAFGRWKPLIEVPKFVPSVSFLEGDGVDEFLQQYNLGADACYGDASRNVKVLKNQNGLLEGSNPFAALHVRYTFNTIGGFHNVKLATQADLERTLKTGALNLRGAYKDSALVLRSERDSDWTSNDYLAGNLAEQVRARDFKLGKLKVPVVIPLNSLDLTRDTSSVYGLAFALRDDAELIEAPILKGDGQFSSEDIDPKTGLPTQFKGGNRRSYTRKDGLSRLYLVGNQDMDSDSGRLARSDSDGRIVVVRGEAAGAEFANKLRADANAHRSELEALYLKDKSAADERFAQAKRIYEGTK